MGFRGSRGLESINHVSNESMFSNFCTCVKKLGLIYIKTEDNQEQLLFAVGSVIFG